MGHDRLSLSIRCTLRLRIQLDDLHRSLHNCEILDRSVLCGPLIAGIIQKGKTSDVLLASCVLLFANAAIQLKFTN